MNVEYDADPLYLPSDNLKYIQRAIEKSQEHGIKSLVLEYQRIRQNPKQFGIEYFFLE